MLAKLFEFYKLFNYFCCFTSLCGLKGSNVDFLNPFTYFNLFFKSRF